MGGYGRHESTLRLGGCTLRRLTVESFVSSRYKILQTTVKADFFRAHQLVIDGRATNSMATETLTSLAILKSFIDKGQDYLDYLKPFILQVLFEQQPEYVTDQILANYILEQFGLKIPDRTVQVVAKRLVKEKILQKNSGQYQVKQNMGDPMLSSQQTVARSRINSVVQEFIEFSKNSPCPLSSHEDAMIAICTFLSKFDVQCLRSYVRGTTIPEYLDSRDTDIVLVSKYVLYLQNNKQDMFESFIVMVQGHMFANALLCPDLKHVSETFRKTTFYFDTPLVVQLIGAEGQERESAAKELLCLLQNLDGRIAIFEHTREELDRVIRVAAEKIEASDGRGRIVFEARSHGTTRSDLLFLANKIDKILDDYGIKTEMTPQYINEFQIDESELGQGLDEELSYYSDRAKEYDINSVRSIYALRKNTSPPSLEKSVAILVTSNSPLAKAAWNYGQQHESSLEVSSVITDFSLANVAWLKAPLNAPELPQTEILAFSYAALQPSNELMNKFLVEVEKLEKKGEITSRDHQLLRSDVRVFKDLMGLTLGSEAALTNQTVTETLKRVTEEIEEEANRKLKSEERLHQDTRRIADDYSDQVTQIKNKLNGRCHRNAGVIAWIVSVSIVIILTIGCIATLGHQINIFNLNPFMELFVVFLGFFGLMSIIFGFPIQYFHQRIRKICQKKLLEKEYKKLGMTYDSSSIDG